MKKLILQVKSFFVFVVLFFSSLFLKESNGELFAQQLPFSSQYYMDPFVINPAFTGTGESINAYLTHRSQWTGLQGSPQTSYLTVDGPVQTKNVGLGLKLYSDVTDIISRSGAFANYSYHLRISDSSNLYFGLAMGIIDTKIDFSKAIIKDNDDPFLYNQAQNKTVFSADFGVAYIWKRLTVGFAIPQVIGNKVAYPIINGDNGYYDLNRHYQGSVKYLFDVSKEKGITAYPLIMARYVQNAPFQYDFNGVIDWKKIGWFGVTYHSTYAVALSAGVRYHNFTVGYAYDIQVSKVRSYTGLASEFLLSYTFGEGKKPSPSFVKTGEPVKDTVKQVIVKTNVTNDTTHKVLIVKSTTPNDSTGKALAAKPKETNDSLNKVLLAQIKSNADANQALFNQLKMMADSNKAEIDRLKSSAAKAKAVEPIATTAKIPMDTSAHTVPNTQNDGMIDKLKSDAKFAKLKTESDSNKAEINSLKAELAKMKTTPVTASNPVNPTTKTSDPKNDSLLARLKTKSDVHQVDIDKLKEELAKMKANPTTSDVHQGDIDKLKEELAKMKANPNTTTTAKTNTTPPKVDLLAYVDKAETKQTETPVNTTTVKTPEAGVRTYQNGDYLDDKGKPIINGYYVVIGTFGSKENADRYKAANIMKGHVTAKIIQNQKTKLYNIFVLKTNNKDDADTERTKYKAEYSDVWILKLE
jgi:type IX secretion system PorP/SprF family membrane protein